MLQKIKGLKAFLIYTAIISVVSVVYFVYVYTVYSPVPERETYLSEIGGELGEIGLWALLFIYGRTLLKILLGKGAIARRLLPDYSPTIDSPMISRVLGLLDRTHGYVGIATIAVILLHIFMMGMPMNILFFPAVLVLLIWQGAFGMFLKWHYTPRELKKFSYLVHAQFITGVTIGVFSYFGHLLIND